MTAMPSPVVVVCGFPRSGSSLTMQMLHAGGFPCIGTWPAFEDLPFGDLLAALPRAGGRAIKLLDAAQVAGFPDLAVPLRSILLRRDPDEQAKSFAKFAGATMGIRTDRVGRKTLARSFDRDLIPLRMWCSVHGPVLELRFESLIEKPLASADAIASFVGGSLDPVRMSMEVRRRSPRCLAGLLELEQVRTLANSQGAIE